VNGKSDLTGNSLVLQPKRTKVKRCTKNAQRHRQLSCHGRRYPVKHQTERGCLLFVCGAIGKRV
jgi:hypothetical protein